MHSSEASSLNALSVEQMNSFEERGMLQDRSVIEATFRMLVSSFKSSLPNSNLMNLAEDAETLLYLNIDGFQYTLIRYRIDALSRLSPREQEIVRLVASGLPNKCIAATLDISIWTVATYLRRIFVKLGVTSRAAMVARVAGQASRVAAERDAN